MKIKCFACLVSMLILPQLSFADTYPPYNKGELSNMHRKFRRGTLNIVASPLEVPKQMTKGWQESDMKAPEKTLWVVPWAVSGVFHGIRRLGGGLYEFVTFNKERPGYFDPVLDPGYVFGPEETLSEKGIGPQHPHIHFRGNLPSDAYLK